MPCGHAWRRRRCSGIGHVEAQEVYAALGIKSDGADAQPCINTRNVDAVLPLLQQFLSVSEKLRAQTLPKVVASLHTYPTGGFPPALCRLAALRELRRRCQEAAGSGYEHEQNLAHAFVLAKQLSGDKLHTRAFGAGQGGGLLSYGGYRLNDVGAFICEQFERCLDGHRPPSPVILSQASLQRLWKKAPSQDCKLALCHGANLPTADIDKINAAQFAEAYALRHTPGALAKGLESRDPQRYDAAWKQLQSQLDAAWKWVQTSLDQPLASFNSASSVAALKVFFDLEKLAKPHLAMVNLPSLAQDPAGIRQRLDFYRAALTWPNKTALAKNMRAIQTELEQMKQGLPRTANPAWSAKFLRSQPKADSDESTKMRERHPEVLAKSTSYKAQVQTLQALRHMRLPALWRAVQKSAPEAGHWIRLQFQAWGLLPPSPPDLQAVLTTLKTAGGVQQLAEKLSQMKTEAFKQQIQNRMDKLVPSGAPRSVLPSVKSSSDSTNDTSQKRPPEP